jgi:hypothetical protein
MQPSWCREVSFRLSASKKVLRGDPWDCLGNKVRSRRELSVGSWCLSHCRSGSCTSSRCGGAAVLYRSGRLHARRRLFAERRVPRRATDSAGLQLFGTDRQGTHWRIHRFARQRVSRLLGILRPRGDACLNVGWRSVKSATRRPLELGMEVSHPGSTPGAETMPASPTSPTRTATAGCYRNAATTIFRRNVDAIPSKHFD